MKRIKLFEDFDVSIQKNTQDIFFDLQKFGFEINVQSDAKRINIEIKKSKKEEQRVFFVDDIYNFLEDCDKYLSLGEGLKLETIYFETIETSKELQSISLLKKESRGILLIFISYLI